MSRDDAEDSMITLEGGYIAPVMYGGATLIGLSRMYSEKRWASDVMTGASIGTVVGRMVVQFHHSHPMNRIDR